jgi:hypothetical protein
MQRRREHLDVVSARRVGDGRSFLAGSRPMVYTFIATQSSIVDQPKSLLQEQVGRMDRHGDLPMPVGIVAAGMG